MTDKKL
jgi:hypothetical protein